MLWTNLMSSICNRSRTAGICIGLAAFMLAVVFTPNAVQAQQDQETYYLLFEFMKVDNEQETAYAETEAFWRKIHEQRVASGEILGWDLWSLQPGGEAQGFQYLTVTIFADPVTMFGDIPFMEHAQNAYPDMSAEDLTAKLEETATTRDLAVRLFLQMIGSTQGDFEMSPGTVTSIDLMKVGLGGFTEYEQAELEIFRPYHQKMVDAGRKGYWELLRVMNPIGSETFASHITINMYRDWEQALSGGWGSMETTWAEDMMYERGAATRDLVWAYMATLRDMVR